MTQDELRLKVFKQLKSDTKLKRILAVNKRYGLTEKQLTKWNKNFKQFKKLGREGHQIPIVQSNEDWAKMRFSENELPFYSLSDVMTELKTVKEQLKEIIHYVSTQNARQGV